jgi:hypothetical protein
MVEANMQGWQPLLRIAACGAWLCLGWTVLPVKAQADTPQATAAYDALIEQALQAYDQGRFAEARTQFRRAHELMPTARTLRTIGMCSFNLGDYVDALANLEAAWSDMRKPLTDDQRKHAADLIARSNQKVGRFRLQLTPARVTLVVDGRAPTLLNEQELLLEPGHHEIAATATGYQSVQTTLNVDGGDRTTLELHLKPLPADAIAAAHRELAGPGAATSGSSSTEGSSGDGSLQSTLGFVSLGLGGAGLAAFAVVGALTLGEQSKLHEHCPDRACAPSYHSDVDRYDALKTATTVSLIAGAAFAALGVSLLVFEPEHAPSERARLEPVIGIGSLGLRGRL